MEATSWANVEHCRRLLGNSGTKRRVKQAKEFSKFTPTINSAYAMHTDSAGSKQQAEHKAQISKQRIILWVPDRPTHENLLQKQHLKARFVCWVQTKSILSPHKIIFKTKICSKSEESLTSEDSSPQDRFLQLSKKLKTKKIKPAWGEGEKNISSASSLLHL